MLLTHEELHLMGTRALVYSSQDVYNHLVSQQQVENGG